MSQPVDQSGPVETMMAAADRTIASFMMASN